MECNRSPEEEFEVKGGVVKYLKYDYKGLEKHATSNQKRWECHRMGGGKY